MDPIIFTPRLKLTLITKAERGSPELEWLHELRSNEKTTLWSLHRTSKSIEDTEKVIKHVLPTNKGEAKTYRVVYAVHKFLGSTSGSVDSEPQAAEQGKQSTELVGLINLTSLGTGALALPEHLTLPAAAAATTLTVELAYMFLPSGWGKGYATESLQAALEACRRARSFWAPFRKLYLRAIVNDRNPASRRVMDKTGVVKRGIYEWTGDALFLGGEWTERDSLHIYGIYLFE